MNRLPLNHHKKSKISFFLFYSSLVPSYIASCSFIHGTSVLISMDRHEYDQFVSSDTLKLYQKDSVL